MTVITQAASEVAGYVNNSAGHVANGRRLAQNRSGSWINPDKGKADQTVLSCCKTSKGGHDC